MAKPANIVTTESPSEQIIKKATQTATVTDALGRQIAVRKLKPLDRMKMSEAAGSDNAGNQSYMLYALVACSLVSIEGDPAIKPTTKKQLEANIDLLGDEGYEAALEAVIEMYGTDKSEEIVEVAKK